MSIDVQGPARARPYAEQAGATYPNAVDTENQLGLLFGFKAVPNAVFVDDARVIRYTKFGGFDIRKPVHRELTERFAESPNLAELEAQAEEVASFRHSEVLKHFRKGLALYREGEVQRALAEWRKGVALEPDNWIIRKQVWAIEHPERFYAGEVDFAWQKEQIARNR